MIIESTASVGFFCGRTDNLQNFHQFKIIFVFWYIN